MSMKPISVNLMHLFWIKVYIYFKKSNLTDQKLLNAQLWKLTYKISHLYRNNEMRHLPKWMCDSASFTLRKMSGSFLGHSCSYL